MSLCHQIVEEALTWVGTPWQHRQCLKGPAGGVDCVRLVEGIAKAVGLLPLAWEPPIYSPEFHLHNNEEVLLAVLAELGCVPLPSDTRQPGDLLVCQYGRVSSHLAVLVARDPDCLVHAAHNHRRVVHQGMSQALARRVRHVYRLPGVAS